MIKAIETVYKGYRFRSRLEARWAVFFDTLGIEWEYEKEGFELGNGVRYLPDFWLPQFSCWVEIKPQNEWGYHRQSDLLSEQSDNKVLYIAGNPWENEYGICVYPIEYVDPIDSWHFVLWKDDNPPHTTELWIEQHDSECMLCLGYLPHLPDRCHSHIAKAYAAAQRARFEHGECP